MCNVVGQAVVGVSTHLKIVVQALNTRAVQQLFKTNDFFILIPQAKPGGSAIVFLNFTFKRGIHVNCVICTDKTENKT